MARKVFISVLGTSFYDRCKYVSGNFESAETSFIQHATLQFHHANEWTAECKAFILLTEKARTDNWIVPTERRYNHKLKEEVPYKGLKEVLTDMQLPFSVEPIAIPDGKDQSEMWQIFETAFNLLEEGDELYLDLTHSFRYLPMLMLVLGNYSKFLKHVEVSAITYGNYEARDEATNKAPIVDLLPLSSLQDWTFATADFLKNGYADRLVELSNKELRPLLKYAENIEDENIQRLRALIAHIESFTSEMLICRGMKVVESKSAEAIRNDIQNLKEIVIPQLEPVLHDITKSVNDFSSLSGVLNLFHAIDWCYNHHLYQQSTTFLEEGVISFFCLRHNIPLDCRKKRELITSAFNIIANNYSEEEWKVEPGFKDLLRVIVDDIKANFGALSKPFNSIVALRNDYNHCGMREGRSDASKIRNRIKARRDSIMQLLYGREQGNNENGTPKLFINLTNHPSAHWSEKQLEAARGFGEIVDIPFPDILPECTAEDIRALADEYAGKIETKFRETDVTVHVMGEMAFTFALVSRLKEIGIRCVASTTERIVTKNDDGTKLSEFSFVKFREY